jgi:hypothetical protein
MSLRRGGVRAIRLLQAYSSTAALQLEAAKPAQYLALQHIASLSKQQPGFGHNRSAFWPSSTHGHIIRYIQTSSERKEDAPKGLPGAQECDEAIEDYTKARLTYKNLRVPSTYKTASQRVFETAAAVWTGTLAVLHWVLSVPAKLWALRLKSREDWARSWANVKKTVKEEAHHYWVSGVRSHAPTPQQDASMGFSASKDAL